MSGDYEQVKLRVWQSEGAYLTMRPLASSWEQRKFSDLTDRISIQSSDSDLPQVEYEDIIPGEGTLNKELRDKEGGKTGIKFYAGDVLYGKLRPYLMNYLYPQFNGVAVGDFWVLRAAECDSSFLYRLVQTGSFQRLANVSSGSKMPRADWNLISQSFFAVPANHAEQKAIAKSLADLDNLITLHQRKYDKLCAVKKSMLDKMFPKPGETEPEIRFVGFTDPWEQRKLGELGFAQSGIGFPNTEQGGTEGTPFFKVSDMNMSGNEHELVASNNYVTPEQIARMGWHPINQVPAIFFAKVGAAVMLNRKRLVNKPFLMDNNTMAFSMDSSLLNTQFGQSLFERLDLTSLIQVGALPSYNSSDVESITVSLPSTMDEQRRIGECLCNINDLITLHQRKLNLLKNTKKSLLDRMFV